MFIVWYKLRFFIGWLNVIYSIVIVTINAYLNWNDVISMISCYRYIKGTYILKNNHAPSIKPVTDYGNGFTNPYFTQYADMNDEDKPKETEERDHYKTSEIVDDVEEENQI